MKVCLRMTRVRYMRALRVAEEPTTGESLAAQRAEFQRATVRLFCDRLWPARALLSGDGFDDQPAFRFLVEWIARVVDRLPHELAHVRLIEVRGCRDNDVANLIA